jgi:hypothetical protein
VGAGTVTGKSSSAGESRLGRMDDADVSSKGIWCRYVAQNLLRWINVIVWRSMLYLNVNFASTCDCKWIASESLQIRCGIKPPTIHQLI